MEKRWALLKGSEIGPMGRGQAGKKKIYEVAVEGRRVTFSWGMAEKSRRQTKVVTYSSEQSAVFFAREKVSEKIDRGYELAFAV